jgi:hypothetical protein
MFMHKHTIRVSTSIHKKILITCRTLRENFIHRHTYIFQTNSYKHTYKYTYLSPLGLPGEMRCIYYINLWRTRSQNQDCEELLRPRICSEILFWCTFSSFMHACVYEKKFYFDVSSLDVCMHACVYVCETRTVKLSFDSELEQKFWLRTRTEVLTQNSNRSSDSELEQKFWLRTRTEVLFRFKSFDVCMH